MKYFALSVIAFLFAAPVFAQVDLGPSLYLAVTPQYPQPNQPVTLTVQNPLVELSERVITWRNNGIVVLQGEGETVYRMSAPGSSERAEITASVEGIETPVSITVAPSSVDLMWETDSYVPGLYQGRHLPSLGSTITFQAMPHLFQKGTEVPPAQLIFTWSSGGKTILSGKGKSSLNVPVAAFVDASTVTVRVTTSDKTLGAEREVSVLTTEPVVHLYFEHPLYGTMYHNALSARSDISDTEMSFAAIPYFAQATGPNDKLFTYIWRVNKVAVEANKEKPNTLTINAGDAGGIARVELSLTHKKNFQLNANGSWDVAFGSFAAKNAGGGSAVDPFTGQ